ncbi:MAG: proline--tRNA ligase [Buchnera aphidicola (Pentalonia nigronervosa)]|jgi:prolyl-tRNA synthetase|uniref:Proline--tRNA ligase n=1 Tax=Buchnera aphidicola (Pentalonia nigronervosa) TaxID=1309793 RepID=A0A7H1AZP1_9GAMM|nr:MAG: proline--tRNA ligase [Buchnera aphidicola (Pentalonia nigronervosa)]
MRATQFLFSTLKEIPHEATIISHQLMLRTGMIKKTSSGLYIWLPIGVRVLTKIINIIKKEMEKINALEITLPIVQPEYLWQNSGRLKIYGDELLKFSDRRKKNFILSPTNEEIITNFINHEICSYKNLPLILYQIKTKFRDEIRPRFGIIRAREFEMKDAYSFHMNFNCLKKTYNLFYKSYTNIFKKIQLKFLPVQANSGSMGGNVSHEFQAFSKNGEDEIAFSNNTAYSSNINMAQSIETLNFLKTYDIKKNIQCNKNYKQPLMICDLDNIHVQNKIKMFLIRAKFNNITSIIAFLIKEDHELNMYKIENIESIKGPLEFIDEQETIALFGVQKKYLGPIGLNIPIIADISTYKMTNFTIGANRNKYFFTNVNWNINLPIPIIKDIRKVTTHDISPDNSSYLNIKKSIEIGHIFQIGKQYSKTMNVSFREKNGNEKHLYMGCYGIGITRIIAAVIEQNHDEKGIIWPDAIAPFEVIILPININKSDKVNKTANNLYDTLKKNGIDVILDDRGKQPGIMFHDADLIGIPHQIIISTRYIENNNIEYRTRRYKDSTIVSIKKITNIIVKNLNKKTPYL